MKGMLNVSYKMLCDSDVSIEVSLKEILKNEKVAKIIKSEFAKGLRNLTLEVEDDMPLSIHTQKEIFQFEVEKKDFADLIEFAEEDAKEHKRVKKGCSGIELVDFVTL